MNKAINQLGLEPKNAGSILVGSAMWQGLRCIYLKCWFPGKEKKEKVDSFVEFIADGNDGRLALQHSSTRPPESLACMWWNVHQRKDISRHPTGGRKQRSLIKPLGCNINKFNLASSFVTIYSHKRTPKPPHSHATSVEYTHTFASSEWWGWKLTPSRLAFSVCS